MNLTILAIDGSGRNTDQYAKLVMSMSSMLSGSRALLLSPDEKAERFGVPFREIPKLDYQAYSKFCVEHLVDYAPEGHCLLVQADGFIVNSEQWDPDWLQYDFIGAPWSHKAHRPIEPGFSVGNGGFSLRSAAYIHASATLKWDRFSGSGRVPKRHLGNEDVFLNIVHRKDLESLGVRFAPPSIAQQFALQSGDSIDPTHHLGTVFGFHGKGLVRKVKKIYRNRGISLPHLCEKPLTHRVNRFFRRKTK